MFGARSRSHIGPEGFDDGRSLVGLSQMPAFKRPSGGSNSPFAERLSVPSAINARMVRPRSPAAKLLKVQGGASEGVALEDDRPSQRISSCSRQGLGRAALAVLEQLTAHCCGQDYGGQGQCRMTPAQYRDFLVIHRILYSDRGLCAGVAARVSRTRYADHAQDACLLIDCLGRFRLLGAQGYSRCQIGCDTAP